MKFIKSKIFLILAVAMLLFVLGGVSYASIAWVENGSCYTSKKCVSLYVFNQLVARLPVSYSDKLEHLAKVIDKSFKKGMLLRNLKIKRVNGVWGVYYKNTPWLVADKAVLRWHNTSGYGLVVAWLNNLYKAFSTVEAARYLSRGGRTIRQIGIASWYGGSRWNGRKTACGEIYDDKQLVAASRTLPFHSLVRVTNLRNWKSVVVRITDRGPYVRGRIIDLSRAAAEALGMKHSGIVKVKVELITYSDRVGGWSANVRRKR